MSELLNRLTIEFGERIAKAQDEMRKEISTAPPEPAETLSADSQEMLTKRDADVPRMDARDKPAFPRIEPDGVIYYGIAMRDYFAAKALVGLLSAEANPQAAGFPCAPYTKEETARPFAQSAYIIADAMLVERAK